MEHSSEPVATGDGKAVRAPAVPSTVGHSLAEAGKEKQSRRLCATLAEGADDPWMDQGVSLL